MRLVGATLLALAPAPALGAACDVVASVAVPDVRIRKTTELGPGFVAPIPDAKALAVPFCRVEGTIEREIDFELWLPERGAWNRRLLVGGVGGQAGNFNYHELARGIARGYASASTDTGHKAGDTHWLLNRADRAANYAHRANHLLAVKAKALLAGAYGKQPAHAFFVGCSGGGRQALTEVQRYPRDFDGVIAGAPGVNTPAMSARRLWEMQRHSAWGASVPARTWQIGYKAAIAQCDMLDGVADGVVEDPRACHFDPGTLACGSDTAAACLDDAQIAALRALHAPLRDENGRQIDAGLLPTVLVSPAALPEPFTPGPSYLATVLFADGVHSDPNWDARKFSLVRDLPAIDRVMNLHASDPAIDPFFARRGKLIIYQGWDDPLVSAQSTLGYWSALDKRFGARLGRSARLFMVPGMEHCRGGPGADLFGGAGGDAPLFDRDHDLLSALESWVLEGRAPERVVATRKVGGSTVRTRPLCAWPKQAVYKGSGDTNAGSSFVCSLVRKGT